MMVRLYCRKQEGNDCLCEECRALLEYAHARLEHCPFGERKTSCKHCKIHCYKPGMRQKMRQLSRDPDARVLFEHPRMAVGDVCGYVESPGKNAGRCIL